MSERKDENETKKPPKSETHLLPLANVPLQLTQPATQLLLIPLDHFQHSTFPYQPFHSPPDLLPSARQHDDAPASRLISSLLEILSIEHRPSESVPFGRGWEEVVRLLEVVKEGRRSQSEVGLGRVREEREERGVGGQRKEEEGGS